MKKFAVLSVCALTFVLVISIVPKIALSVPTTYAIGVDNAPNVPGFSASFLHSATSGHSQGYWMSGNTASISGTITIDLANNSASGMLIMDLNGDTDFGLGSANWKLNITGAGKSANLRNLSGLGDSMELLHLDYTLTNLTNGNGNQTGTFYFAANDYNGGSSPSPNEFTASRLILWGNNWINQYNNGNGTAKPAATNTFTPLGIDLFGTRVPDNPVPEPTTMLLFGFGVVGLIGAGATRKFKGAKKEA